MGAFTDDGLFDYPIELLAEHLGIRKDRGVDTYFAPNRDETKGSLHLYPKTNTFCDFGAGVHGGLLKFIEYARGCSRKDAVDYLKEVQGRMPAIVIEHRRKVVNPFRSGVQASERRVLVDTDTSVVNTVVDPVLLDYASKRRIDIDILQHYCQQLTYHIKGYEDRHTVVAFPHVNNGYVLRGPGRNEKICTNQGITLINSLGRYSIEPVSDTVMVVEGFFDYLAFLSYRHYTSAYLMTSAAKVVPLVDVVVLNSINNLPRAYDYLGAHRRILSYVDGDRGGRECYGKMCEFCSGKGIAIEDRMGEFTADFEFPEGVEHTKDFNDFLIAMDRLQDIVKKKPCQPLSDTDALRDDLSEVLAQGYRR